MLLYYQVVQQSTPCMFSFRGEGDEVIVPTITHTATAHSVEYTGAKPIFVQCDMLTGNMDLNDLRKLIKPSYNSSTYVRHNGRYI